jgi:hypothetical protein
MDGRTYCDACIRKLEVRVAKEAATPIPVMLDQRFAAPHLASGTPKHVALGLWRDLDEIREPALLVSARLENPNVVSSSRLVDARSEDEADGKPVSVEQFQQELGRLSLDEFLRLLEAVGKRPSAFSSSLGGMDIFHQPQKVPVIRQARGDG